VTEQRPARRKLFLLGGGLLVLVAAGVLTGLTRSGGSTPAIPKKAALATGWDVCADQITISLDPDENPTPDATARQTAAALRDDKQIAAIAVQTQQQSSEQFKPDWPDEPDLAALGRPQALPAKVWLRAFPRVDLEQLADRLRDDSLSRTRSRRSVPTPVGHNSPEYRQATRINGQLVDIPQR
jgi:hypothetical protein